MVKSWILAAIVALFGQQAGPAAGTIDGRVTDSQGGVIPGVTVSVSSPALGAQRTLTTDDRGSFRADGLRAGAYEVTLTLPSFRTLRGQVQLAAGRTAGVSFQMQLGAREEIVNVRASNGLDQTTPAATRPGATTPIRVGGSVQEPNVLRRVMPMYPNDAFMNGAEGVVLIEAVIARDGTVRDARVVQGVPGLDGAALTAVRQWLYTPTLLNGVPVEVVMNVRISFAR